MPRNRLTDLYAYWSKKENDIMFHYPTSKPDGHLLCLWLCTGRWDGRSMGKSLMEELDERGFDTTTIKFSIRLKEPPHV